MIRFNKAPGGRIHVSLWHSPFNGGWIWFDRKQIKSFRRGWRKPTLWWCFFGFCGYITLQSTPWGTDPGARGREFLKRHQGGDDV